MLANWIDSLVRFLLGLSSRSTEWVFDSDSDSSFAHPRTTHKLWAAGATQLGLVEIRSGGGGIFPNWFTARYGKMIIEVNEIRSGSNTLGTRFTITAPDLLPERLVLRSESLTTMIGKAFSGEDVEIGDPTFDRDVFVQGYPPLILALVDRGTRYRILELVRPGGHVQNQRLVWIAKETVTGQELFTYHLEKAISLAQLLTAPVNLAQNLAFNVRNEIILSVRLRNLELLTQRFPEHPETTALLQELLSCHEDLLLLEAAKHLGVVGHKVLLEFVARSDGDEYLTSQAITALGAALPCSSAIHVLDRGIAKHLQGLTSAAIGALGKNSDPKALDRLAEVMRGSNIELSTLVLQALSHSKQPRAESMLLAALDRDHSELRSAAAESLGRVGTIASVPALRETMKAHSMDSSFKKVALKAIGMIQARAKGAQPGQLSMAGGEVGQLTLSNGTLEGQITIVTDDQSVPNSTAKDVRRTPRKTNM